MRKLEFTVQKGTVMGVHDAAYLSGGAEPSGQALVEAVTRTLGTDINVTVSGVTMFLAAWEDPDHWSSDWAEKLGVDPDDAPEAVAQLLADATSDS